MRYVVLALPLLALSTGVLAQDRPTDTRLLWGDTHLHTSNSFDVYLFGTPAATPDTAYRFAKGLPVVSPTTGTRWQLRAPLDFLVIADHAELVGSIFRLYGGDPAMTETESGRALLGISPNRTTEEPQRVYDELSSLGSGVDAGIDLTIDQVSADLHGGDARRTSWEANIDAAEAHNEPGSFTSLIGWEWTSQPSGANLHRVVFLANDGDVARQFLPLSSLESFDPRDLWAWLAQTSEETGADFVAIPHNPNISMGLMFPTETLDGSPLDEAYVTARAR